MAGLTASRTALPPSRLTALFAVTTLLLALALIWAVRRPAPVQPVTRYRVTLAAGRGLAGNPWSRLAVSPDGSRLVYVGDAERSTQLFVRTRDELDAVALPGTEGAINPAFSPNGTQVAFMDRVTAGHVKVVSLNGGAPITITDSLVGAPGVAWGSDGYIYYDRIGVGPLMRVSAAGGKAEGIGQLDTARGELQHAWPDVLPNGKGVIMTVSHGAPGAMGGAAEEIAVLDLATGRHRVLLRGVFARFARSGHLVYVTAQGALMSVPFDQNRMELTGDAVALSEGVAVRTGGGAVDLTLSATGTLWYAAGGVGSAGTFEAVWVGRDGSAVRVSDGLTGLIGDPALSPDGRRLALSTRELVSEVLIKELDQGGALSKLTVDGNNNIRPAWSPDGRSVAFLSGSPVNRDARERLADGSRPPTVLLDDRRSIEEVTFSHDGAWLVYRGGVGPGERDLFARRLGTDSSIALAATSADETSPALSPDGRWLAYVSNESGATEVYVRPFPSTADGRWQISAHGGQEPVWAHSGRELFYRTAGTLSDSQMVMQVTTGHSFVPGARRALFPMTRYATGSTHQQYAVAPDDRRFLMIRATEANRTDQLIVVENFFEVLRARAARR